MYVSYCPELDIASCGEDVGQAKRNLHEAILINIEKTKEMGTLMEFLENCILKPLLTIFLPQEKNSLALPLMDWTIVS
ncbi:MAG: type II toxin-antitoxin system HicB family antitoxin [Deltaproteobacteria bacterium]|nr:type II toxin-antitoxin system HicB family antitoxin [Deltaproteobacteria bacterium]